MHASIKVLAVGSVLLAAGTTAAQATPAAIQDGYVLAGISDYGTLGSNGGTSPGILYDKTGTANYGVNDFLTPGTPFEGFYLRSGSGSVTGANNTGNTNFSVISPTTISGSSASWTGTDGTFQVTNTYTLGTISGRSVIGITTDITNLTGSTISDLSFLRTLDPDPDVNAFGSYYTTNAVLSSSQACGTGPSSGETICIGTTSTTPHAAGVSAPWTTDPVAYLGGLNDGNGDYAIGLAFNLGDLAAGLTTQISYFYALGASRAVASDEVPEPLTLALLASTLLGIGVLRRQKMAV